MYFSLADEFPQRSKLVELNQSNPPTEGYKKPDFLREKGNSRSLTCSRQGVNNTEWADHRYIASWTDRPNTWTHTLFWPTKLFEHSPHHKWTGNSKNLICVLLAGYPNKTTKISVKGLNPCLLFFSSSNWRWSQLTFMFFTTTDLDMISNCLSNTNLFFFFLHTGKKKKKKQEAWHFFWPKTKYTRTQKKKKSVSQVIHRLATT